MSQSKKQETNLASVFVRNLPYDTTDAQLEEHFSDVGPLKEAYVIRDKKTKAGRGFAFVSYVLPEDAHEMARRFAGAFDDETPDRFHGTTFTETDFGPVLPRATAFTCRLEQSYHHATHEICIGAVTGISNAGEQPLTYLHGTFHVVRPKQSL